MRKRTRKPFRRGCLFPLAKQFARGDGNAIAGGFRGRDRQAPSCRNERWLRGMVNDTIVVGRL